MPPLSRIAAAALPVVFFLSAHAHAVAGGAPGGPRRERESDVQRAEKILVSLRRLETLSASAQDSNALGSAVRHLYPGLFAEVAAMREGGLKSDLSTAVFLHYDLQRTRPASSSSIADCGGEPRDFYRRLCVETRGGTRAELMRAKARAHTSWAAAVVDYLRQGRGRATLDALAEMRAERAVDLTLAARAVSALRRLEGGVRAHRTLAEFEERGEVAGVPFARLCESVSEALRSVDPLLASLPRGPVRLALQNARNSYRDGLFWWRMTRRRDAPAVVAADAPAEADPLEAARLDPAAARYTVVINWRSALRYTAQAEDLIRSSGSGDIAAQP